MNKTIVKRALNSLLIVLMMFLIVTAINDFDAADTWLELFKAVFWIVVAVVALWSLVDDIRENNWPWEIWK